MKVPWIELGSLYTSIRDELDDAYFRVMKSGNFVLGPEVEAFEESFAEFCGVRHCVGVGSGLDALHLALLSLGIGPGDEVLVPSNTFIATWFAVSYCGATPVPVEPDVRTYNMDPRLIRKSLSKKTKAIIPVDLYGQPADADAITEVAKEYNLFVVGDAAQSHGASYHGKRTGSFYDAECFSFYPVKNLGAYGDGGAVTTNSDAIADRLRLLRNYGSTQKYHHVVSGYNSRLDELQAAFLKVKLNHLERWTRARRATAQLYTRLIQDRVGGGNGITLPHTMPGVDASWHLYVIRLKERDRIRRSLQDEGVATLIHYPVPPHMQPPYTSTGITPRSLPVAESISSEVLSLPLHPLITEEEVQFVVESLVELIPRL